MPASDGTRFAWRAPLSRRIGGEHRFRARPAALRTSLRLYGLRHTAAAASWLACGLPLIYVQRQLGHASPAMIEALYGHLEEAFLRHAAERVEERIRGAPHRHRPDGPGARAHRVASHPVAATAEMLPRVSPRPG